MRPQPYALLLAVVSVCSCAPGTGPTGKPLQISSAGEAFGGTQCSAVRPQTEPDLMAWDPASRSNLNRLRREGVVAVRYHAQGCNVELELLSHCVGSGKYAFSPYSANERKLARNADELFAQLPIGAARLVGKVDASHVIRTDYMLAGAYSLPGDATFVAADLRGADCARATHVVSAIYVGAFAMGAGESRSVEAGATLLGVGAGGKTASRVEILSDEGDAEACRASQRDRHENDGCAVPLRIGLLALSEKSAAAPESPVPSSAPPAAQGDGGPHAGQPHVEDKQAYATVLYENRLPDLKATQLVVALDGAPVYNRTGDLVGTVPIYEGSVAPGSRTVSVVATFEGKRRDGKAFKLQIRSAYTLTTVPGDKVAVRISAQKHERAQRIEEGAYLQWEVGAGAGSMRPIDTASRVQIEVL